MARVPYSPKYVYRCPVCHAGDRHDVSEGSDVVFGLCPKHTPEFGCPRPRATDECPDPPPPESADNVLVPNWWGWAALAFLISLFLAAQSVFMR